jgi:hypothetical protein
MPVHTPPSLSTGERLGLAGASRHAEASRHARHRLPASRTPARGRPVPPFRARPGGGVDGRARRRGVADHGGSICADRRSRRLEGSAGSGRTPTGGAGSSRAARWALRLPLAAGRPPGCGAPVRAATTALAARAPRRRSRRRAGCAGVRGRARPGQVRGSAGRARGREHRPRRWPAHHVRAGHAGGGRGPGGAGRRPDRDRGRRPSGLPGRRLPALGTAARRGVPGSAGAAGPREGTPAAASRSRGAPATARRAGRTRRPCCTPGRTGAAARDPGTR